MPEETSQAEVEPPWLAPPEIRRGRPGAPRATSLSRGHSSPDLGQGNSAKGFSQAKGIIFRYLKYRPRSEKEIVDKLRKKNIDDATIEQTLEYLRKAQLLDDVLFARGWIASRLRKPFGLRRIRQELSAKGIRDEIIRQEMPSGESDYDETAAALELAQKRWAKFKGVPKLKAKKRIYDYLVRRGFRFETAQKIIYQIEKKVPE